MMKKNINIIIVLVVLIIILSSCGTKSADIPTTTEVTQEAASSSDETSVNSTTQEVSTEETSGISETTTPETSTKQNATSETETTPERETEATTAQPTATTAIPKTEASALNTLKITGNVAFEMTITLDELKSLDDIVVEEDYYSVNTFGTKGHTRFKGLNLWYLLDQYAGIDEDASSITVLATDGYQMTFTIEQIMKQDYIDETDPNKKLPVIIAWEEDGVEYDPEDGAPYKLAIGQVAPDDVNKPQWVSMIDSIIVE
ncbi:MAG: Uncharacterized protein XD91_1676 [Clostridiales bacterium 38_11]|nr:MAG: Uncharacterized protein XD91_1676 [Clostridiales bacterium 38_11]